MRELFLLKSQLSDLVDSRLTAQQHSEEQRERLEGLTLQIEVLRERVRTAEEERNSAREEAREGRAMRGEVEREREARGEAERAREWAKGVLRVKEGEVEEMKKTVKAIQRAMQ